MRIRLQLQTSIQLYFTHVFTKQMTAQTPATAEIEKWLRIPLFPKFWLRVWIRKTNAESCRSRHQESGSGPTFGPNPKCFLACSWNELFYDVAFTYINYRQIKSTQLTCGKFSQRVKMTDINKSQLAMWCFQSRP